MRIGDIAASTALVLPTALAASIGGRNIDVRSKRAAQANVIVGEPAGGGGSDTITIKFQDSPKPVFSDQINAYDLTDDGSEKLRDGAASNLEFDVPFQPTADVTLYSVKLMLSRLGTPALAGGGIPDIFVSIETDNAGDPSNTVVGGASRAIACADIGTDLAEYTFFFDHAVDLTAATPYHIVVAGDYDVSATDCIQLHYNTVVGTSTCKHYDAAWSAADANIDYWFRLEELTYTDISTAIVATKTFTESTIHNLMIDGVDRKEINLELVNQFMRAYYTISADTWLVYHAITIGDPTVQPVV